MKRMSIVGLCLVTALVMSALAASSASALPEIGRCVAKTGSGFYGTNKCEKKLGSATGNFEWLKGSGNVNGFTATSGVATLQGKSGTTITCKESTAVGKYDEDGTQPLGSRPIKGVESVVATFHECEEPAVGKLCQSAGAGAGTIVTKTLEGNLGYIKKITPKEVGQELHPNPKTGAFAEFFCGAEIAPVLKVIVKAGATGQREKEGGTEVPSGGNCIIGKLKEFNVMATKDTTIYAKAAAGVQKPQFFENKKPPICNLEAQFNAGVAGTPFERSTQEEEAPVTSAELEVKA